MLSAEIYYHLFQGGEGESTPVVLIHGAGGNHLHWPPEIRRLPDCRVFAIDLPGHGKSRGRGHQTIDAYAQSILDWMESIHLSRAVFVGHSMGGAIAQTLAYKHPEHVVALGLVGTGARLRVSPLILENTASPATFPTAIKTIIEWSFSPQANARLVELAARRMAETRQTVLYGDFLACNTFDLMDSVAKIRLPALVVCGDQDRLTPLRYSQYLADQIPNARLQIVPDAGHMVMLEQPQRVATALEEFVATLVYRPGDLPGF